MLQLPWRGAFIFLALLVAVSAPSCANSSENPADAGTDAKPIGPCGPGTAVKCGDTCVDTQSDFQNCGACGTKCPSDQVCSHGACSAVCGGGTARCGNDCIDTKSDVNDCGGCGQKCPSGNVCNNGSCALTCQAGLTDCNGDCVDVNQNDDNCGACGQPCGGGQVCSSGKCVATCQAGWSTCSVGDAGATTCVDTRFDPKNCGACNTPCPSGELCSPVNNVGACSLQCNGGTSKCNNACVDENIDPNNCGACNATCSGNCSAGHCCASGQIYCGGCDTVANCVLKSGGVLGGGGSHTCAVNFGSGTLKCWGDDSYGQLGDGQMNTTSTSPIPVPLSGVTYVAAGGSTTCALAAGTAYCWGFGTDGEIGDGLGTDEASPSKVSSLTAPTMIDNGGDQGCALDSGTVKCWGGNFYGDLGNADAFNPQNSPITPSLGTATEVNTGLGDHTCAILGGNVKCWGEQDYGECGDNDPNNLNGYDDTPADVVDTNNVKLANVTHIALGGIHTCAIVSTNGGDVWCWGDDEFGELGDGQTGTQSYVPVKANVSNVVALAVGGDGFLEHSCALTSAGAVYCWGSDDYGQVGNGTTSTNGITTPYEVFTNGVIAIAAGYTHTCAMKGDGTVWCWGNNDSGQLGDGTTTERDSPVQVSGF